MRTPWGESYSADVLEPGIAFHATSSHGGYKVDRPLLDKIPLAWRRASFGGQGLQGWFEEDCDWCIVALTFPGHFPHLQKEAQATFNHYIAQKLEPVAI